MITCLLVRLQYAPVDFSACCPFSYSLLSFLRSFNVIIVQYRYMEENGHSSSSNARASHIVGRLGSLIRVFLKSLVFLFFSMRHFFLFEFKF